LQIYSQKQVIDVDVKYLLLFVVCKIGYVVLSISDVIGIVVCPLFKFNIKTLDMRHLYDKKRLIYNNQTIVQHLLRKNKGYI